MGNVITHIKYIKENADILRKKYPSGIVTLDYISYSVDILEMRALAYCCDSFFNSSLNVSDVMEICSKFDVKLAQLVTYTEFGTIDELNELKGIEGE